jgi:hypothetical protein
MPPMASARMHPPDFPPGCIRRGAQGEIGSHALRQISGNDLPDLRMN